VQRKYQVVAYAASQVNTSTGRPSGRYCLVIEGFEELDDASRIGTLLTPEDGTEPVIPKPAVVPQTDHGAEPHVVAVGNAFDGVTLYGPFHDANEAIEYAEKNVSSEWSTVVVVPPNA
jgi:hypothetical protein